MSTAPKSPPSFSRAQRWKNVFDRTLRTLLVLAVVAMVNYLGATFSQRLYLSSQTGVALAPRTLAVLRSLTNQVEVTLYFDRRADFYPDVKAVLDEYAAASKKISVRLVDYVRDAGEAQKIKAKYGLNAAADKDLIILDSGGRTKMLPSSSLLEYGAVGMTEDKQVDIRPVRFKGEMAFTAMLLALQNPQPLKAYFLVGHNELLPDDSGQHGLQKFGLLLQQNYFSQSAINLTASTEVPADCNLLVIAAPSARFTEIELQKIDRYLREGGRLFVLFSSGSLAHVTDLENLLLRWGVQVPRDYVKDPDSGDSGVFVSSYGKHPVVASLPQLSLKLYIPRPVNKTAVPTASSLQVDELLYSSENTVLAGDLTAAPKAHSLACAVEQKPIAGVVNPRGNARLIVAGDAIFLGNTAIEYGSNRDFLNAAVNWLVDRPQLVDGVGPRSISEFRLLLTDQQQQQLRGLLLGVLPGGVLLFGGLVWLVRRK
jgi:hypothetical protein